MFSFYTRTEARGGRQLTPVCLFAALCFTVFAHAQSEQSPLQAPTQEQSMPPAPPASTLDQMSSRLPTVTLHNGELSIVAYNSTLRDILEMVRSQTGATIEIPPNANERVFVQLGPGPVRQVLASLLAGSDFNFVVLTTDSDPPVLSQLVLSPKRPSEGANPLDLGLPSTNGISSGIVRRRRPVRKVHGGDKRFEGKCELTGKRVTGSKG